MRTISTLLFLQLLFLGCQKNETGNTTTIKVIPAAPSDLIVTLLSGTKVKLDWIDKSTNEDGFKIERKTGSSGFSVAGMTAKDITTFTDSALSLGSSYTYRVYAYNTVGASLTYTNEVTITTIGVPVLTTLPITDTTAKTALSGGLVSTDGGSPISVRGVVWGTASNPTIALSSKTTDGTGTGSFSSKITGLMANTKYYARAYATNNAGTSYGNELSFTTNNIDLEAGLVAYYPFNGNANDESGNGNNGIIKNSVSITTDRTGITNSAFNFNGGTIEIPHKSYLAIQQGGNFCISIWVNKSGDENPVHIIGKRPAAAHEFNWLIGQHTSPGGAPGGGLVFTGVTNTNESGIGYSGISDSTLIKGRWENIVGTFNQGEWNLYKNGKLVASKKSLITPIDTGNPVLEIGNCGGWGAFIGKIDDIRIYNRNLTETEIKYIATH
jgi:hypothetical protein